MTGSRPGTTIVGIGAAAHHPGTDVVLDLGPQHPSAHGGLQVRLTVQGDRITAAEPMVGFMHRGVEKLFEARDYRQAMMLANRHDWLSAVSSELGIALAVERLLGLEVPVRATWIRTLLAEVNRLTAHLAFVVGVAGDTGLPEVVRDATAARESLLAVLESYTGGRMHVMVTRIGGVKEDLPADWLDDVAHAADDVHRTLARLTPRLLDDEGFVARTAGVGVLDASLVAPYGLSGPLARASGVDADLRRDAPYLAYDELAADGDLEVPVRREGDAFARVALLLYQATVGLRLVTACADRLRTLPNGPVNVRLPKNLKAPEATTYTAVEGPLGLNGYYLVSRADKTPWRLKLRTASFNHVSVLPELLVGTRVTELSATLGSLLFVTGDVDK